MFWKHVIEYIPWLIYMYWKHVLEIKKIRSENIIYWKMFLKWKKFRSENILTPASLKEVGVLYQMFPIQTFLFELNVSTKHSFLQNVSDPNISLLTKCFNQTLVLTKCFRSKHCAFNKMFTIQSHLIFRCLLFTRKWWTLKLRGGSLKIYARGKIFFLSKYFW